MFIIGIQVIHDKYSTTVYKTIVQWPLLDHNWRSLLHDESLHGNFAIAVWSFDFSR